MNVDIILPVYRGRRYLREAVDSVFAQTFDEWHLWIVDDASPEDSLAPVTELCCSHQERISLLRLEENRGAAAARTVAIDKSSSAAIAFLDQDDRWRPNKLALQVKCLCQAGVAAVHTDVVHIDAEGHLLPDAAVRENTLRARVGFESLSQEALTRALFLQNSIRLGSSLVLREAFENSGGFRTSLRGGEDWEFWVRFVTEHPIAHLPEPLLERRVHSQNTSSLDTRARTAGMLEALYIVERERPDLKYLGGRRRSWIGRKPIIEALRAARYSDARRSAWALVRLRPFDWRALALLFISSSGPLGAPLVRSLLRG